MKSNRELGYRLARLFGKRVSSGISMTRCLQFLDQNPALYVFFSTVVQVENPDIGKDEEFTNHENACLCKASFFQYALIHPYLISIVGTGLHRRTG